MALRYVIKKCPYCNTTNSISQYSDLNIGSPFIECRKCRREFVDKERKELFLHPDAWVVKKNTVGNVLLSLIGLAMGILMLFASSWTKDFRTLLLVFGIIISLGGLCLLIIPFISYSERLKEWEKEYQESKKRCENHEYLELLNKYDL